MVFQPDSNKKTTGGLTVMAAVMFVCLVFVASGLWAATYTVTGQVFRVTSLELEAKTAPDGTIDFATMATGSFPFVHIKIYRSGTSELLGEGDAGINGQFNIVFNHAGGPPGPDVEFRVYKVIDGGSTQQPAVDETYNTASAIGLWTTNKKLLAVNNDIIDYLDGADPTTPGVGLVYTRVGKVPTAYIPQGAAAGAERGLADVPGAAPAYVPRFVDAPFGGRLLIFGNFGPPKTGCAGSQVDWYQITITNLDGGSPVILKDTLSKVKTIVSTTVPLTISNDTEKLGPFTGDDSGTTIEGMYRVDRDSALTYYAYPDLRAYWNTSGQSGLFKITVRYYRDLGTGTPTAPDVDEMTVGGGAGDCFDPVAPGTPIGELIVRVNNNPLDVTFDGIYVKVNAGDPDGFDYNTDGVCSIMDLEDASNDYGIQIKYTAHHTGDYMRSYSLTATANDTLASGGPADVKFLDPAPVYDPTAAGAPLWAGTPAAGTSVFKGHTSWTKTCSYIIDLIGTSRVQNGYNYIQRVHKRRTYYIIHN